MSNTLTVNDFFCGAGGMGLGFQQAGYEIKGAWDFDKYAVQSYAANVGAHVVQADITKMVYTDVPRAKVWTFGFPCQDVSVAGKTEGLKIECFTCGYDWVIKPKEYTSENQCPNCGSTRHKAANRSGMLFEIMRLLEETANNVPENLPAVIVAENVKGLKPYLEVLRAEYEKVGYYMYFQLFNSKYWGVPQNRERYFVVGVRKDITASYEYPVEITTNVPKLSSILAPEVDAKYYVADEKAQAIIAQALEKLDNLGTAHATVTPARIDKRQRGPRAKEEEEAMFTLTAQDLHGVIQSTVAYSVQEVATAAGLLSSEDCGKTLRVGGKGSLTARHNYEHIVEPQIKVLGMMDAGTTQEHNNRVHDPEGISPTATAVAGGTHHIKILDYSKYRVRKLTPTEYGRLQAFPDTWKQVVSDSQAYKQFGNAVTVTVAKAVAESIKRILL